MLEGLLLALDVLGMLILMYWSITQERKAHTARGTTVRHSPNDTGVHNSSR